MKRQELRLSGSGGQGLILAGIILAEAALHDGNNVVQSQSYGPEARGGLVSRSYNIWGYYKLSKSKQMWCIIIFNWKAYDNILTL